MAAAVKDTEVEDAFKLLLDAEQDVLAFLDLIGLVVLEHVVLYHEEPAVLAIDGCELIPRRQDGKGLWVVALGGGESVMAEETKLDVITEEVKSLLDNLVLYTAGCQSRDTRRTQNPDTHI